MKNCTLPVKKPAGGESIPESQDSVLLHLNASPKGKQTNLKQGKKEKKRKENTSPYIHMHLPSTLLTLHGLSSISRWISPFGCLACVLNSSEYDPGHGSWRVFGVV